jgi:hypothetical protein
MALRFAYLTFITATLLVAPTAFAQTDSPPPMAMPPGQPPPPMQPAPPPRGAVACGPDFARFCRGVPPGGGRIVLCLLGHRAELSPACSAEMAALRPGPGVAAMPPPGPPAPPPPPGYAPPPPAGNRGAFVAACGPDVQALCPGVPRDGIVKCLVAHRMEVTVTCKEFLKQARAERAAQTPSMAQPPSNNPPPPPPGAADMPPGPPPEKVSPPPAGAPANE